MHFLDATCSLRLEDNKFYLLMNLPLTSIKPTSFDGRMYVCVAYVTKCYDSCFGNEMLNKECYVQYFDTSML